METQAPHRYIFIGNPGTGKSSLLNALVDNNLFSAGVSIGNGRTLTAQEFLTQDKSRIYVDTPGLEDVHISKIAASEITEALRKGGYYHIFFVCMLDAGRIRMSDKKTIQAVTTAAKLKQNEYGLIMNKVPAKTIQRIEGSASESKKFCEGINDGLPGTKHIIFNPYDQLLEDEEDRDVAPTLSFDFKLQIASTKSILLDDVGDILPDDSRKVLQEMERLQREFDAHLQEQRYLKDQLEREEQERRRIEREEQEKRRFEMEEQEKKRFEIERQRKRVEEERRRIEREEERKRDELESRQEELRESQRTQSRKPTGGASNRTYYKCPNCGDSVYVITGAPYKGACADCLSRMNPIRQVQSGVSGVISGFSKFFS